MFEGFGAVQVGIQDTSVSVVGSESTDGRVVLDLNAEGPAPSAVRAQIRWRNGGETLLLVPYPARQAAFITADNRTMPPHGSWVAHQVPRVTAVFTATTGHRHAPYIEGELRAIDVDPGTREASRFEVSLPPETKGGNETGRFVLPLARIRNHIELALASTMDLDARVQLRLTWNGCTGREGARLDVYRYEGKVQTNGGTFATTTEQEAASGAEPVELTAFLFRDPTERHELVATTDGEWTSPMSTWKPGTWCVLGRRGRALSHRPLVVPLDGELPDNRWARVAEIPGMEPRREGYRLLLHHLATVPDDQAWHHVLDVFDIAETLPATTFDVLDQMTFVPEAAAMSLLRAPNCARVWEEMEELPFMWQLLSVRAWGQSIDCYLDSLRARISSTGVELTPAVFVSRVADVYRNHLDGEHPLFVLLERRNEWGLKVGRNSKEAFTLASVAPGALIDSVLNAERQDLLRRQTRPGIRWPQWDPPTVFSSVAELQGYRLPTELDWQRAVLDAPLVAAAACALDWELPRPHIIKLRRLREFDARWFDFAYRVLLTILLAQGICNES